MIVMPGTHFVLTQRWPQLLGECLFASAARSKLGLARAELSCVAAWSGRVDPAGGMLHSLTNVGIFAGQPTVHSRI